MAVLFACVRCGRVDKLQAGYRMVRLCYIILNKLLEQQSYKDIGRKIEITESVEREFIAVRHCENKKIGVE